MLSSACCCGHLLSLAVVSWLVFTRDADPVSRTHFDRLSQGMSVDGVVKLLGPASDLANDGPGWGRNALIGVRFDANGAAIRGCYGPGGPLPCGKCGEKEKPAVGPI